MLFDKENIEPTGWTLNSKQTYMNQLPLRTPFTDRTSDFPGFLTRHGITSRLTGDSERKERNSLRTSAMEHRIAKMGPLNQFSPNCDKENIPPSEL